MCPGFRRPSRTSGILRGKRRNGAGFLGGLGGLEPPTGSLGNPFKPIPARALKIPLEP